MKVIHGILIGKKEKGPSEGSGSMVRKSTPDNVDPMMKSGTRGGLTRKF